MPKQKIFHESRVHWPGTDIREKLLMDLKKAVELATADIERGGGRISVSANTRVKQVLGEIFKDAENYAYSSNRLPHEEELLTEVAKAVIMLKKSENPDSS